MFLGNFEFLNQLPDSFKAEGGGGMSFINMCIDKNGKQWTDFGGVNQIKQAVETIKNNPNSRRIIVNAWNVSELDQMALSPCHGLVQS